MFLLSNRKSLKSTAAHYNACFKRSQPHEKGGDLDKMVLNMKQRILAQGGLNGGAERDGGRELMKSHNSKS